MRDPEHPRLAGDWHEPHSITWPHDLTEVTPGILLTSSLPMLLLDVRADPTRPKLLAMGDHGDARNIHGVAWPHAMQDTFFLAGGKAPGPACDITSDATFMTWDARSWRQDGKFRLIDDFRVTRGTATDGRAPATTWCAHWFDVHPRYRQGGVVAMAWYEHGTRLLLVDPTGQIEEIGWFLGYGGSAAGAYWASNDVLYVADFNRGLDVLRWKGAVPAPGPTDARPTQPAGAEGPAPSGRPRSQRVRDLLALPQSGRCLRRGRLPVRPRAPHGRKITRVTVRVAGRPMVSVERLRVSRTVVLKGLRRVPTRVRISVWMAGGERLDATARYRRC